MGSVICWKRTHILVFNFFFVPPIGCHLGDMCCISYLFTHSLMKSFIKIDLDAEFGASMSPCVCAHPCASLHMCVRAMKPEED